ncbi:hypothetical protein [Comamonas terrae]|uniref:Uncharacterized protein n=1 Tax=Comamonas terrae TaxID=673548 RepID=A0ABW5UL51_9BURK|nr:hypothetical protein [Comamonas terrae]
MTQSADKFPRGVPFEMGQILIEALRKDPELAGAKVLDNPERASDLQDGPRIVFLEDQRDTPLEQPGQLQQRIYHFSVGVIARTQLARAQAHGDYRLVKRILRNRCMPLITAAGIRLDGLGLQEGAVHYRLENIDVGGSLVLGAFTIQYRDPS